MEGTVKWFNRKKGYGFIVGEDGKDYFVHYTAVPRGVYLRDNDKVTFEPVQDQRGLQATNVVLTQKASEYMDQERPKDEQPEPTNEDLQEAA